MKRRSMLLAATALSCAAGLAHAGDLSFAPVPFPADDAARRMVVATSAVTIDGQTAAISYNVLARTGDMIGGQMFGQLTDRDGKPLPVAEGQMAASSAPDFTSLLPVGGKLFALTHFEELPAAIYLSEVAQDAEGKLSFTSTRPLDLSSVDGIWDPCAGNVTPWNTHLGSEEYPADARAHEEAKTLDEIDEEVRPMARYFGLNDKTMTLEDYRAKVDPYRYGFPVEYTVAKDGSATVAKHYSMGRLSVELANIMPDQKTAYISDDGTNVGLFRYVADKAGDLTAGQLFAAKWLQTSDQNGGAASVEWIDLGHADDATVRAALTKGTKFSDLFETAESNAKGTCPEGFLSSNAAGRAECLKVKAGMEMITARLETRRYASMLGATTEFRKMEGSAYNPDQNRLYISISDVGKGMTDGDEKADKGGRNDIRLAKNPCGEVLELTLGADYAGTTLKALVAGKPTDYAADSPYTGNDCDVDGIASPDNLTFIAGHDTLIIGEDTDHHQNDAIWAMNLTSGTLTRIATTPYGSEATSVDWYPNVSGHGYLVAVVQHPYGETDADKLAAPSDANAYVGYFGPFPAVKQDAGP